MHIFGVSLGISAFHSAAFPASISAHVLHFPHVSLLVAQDQRPGNVAVAQPWKSTATCSGCQSFHHKNCFLNRIIVNNLLNYSDGNNKDT